MKKALILVIAALAIPGVALAAGHTPTRGGKSAPKVMYVLKGKLSGYQAYNSVGPVTGSITIVVSHANYHGRALKGDTLTFPVGANTRVTLDNGAPIADNDRGVVTVRAPKRIAAADLDSMLQTYTARHIVDQGTGA
jgi:hypothetical protein